MIKAPQLAFLYGVTVWIHCTLPCSPNTSVINFPIFLTVICNLPHCQNIKRTAKLKENTPHPAWQDRADTHSIVRAGTSKIRVPTNSQAQEGWLTSSMQRWLSWIPDIPPHHKEIHGVSSQEMLPVWKD